MQNEAGRTRATLVRPHVLAHKSAHKAHKAAHKTTHKDHQSLCTYALLPPAVDETLCSTKPFSLCRGSCAGTTSFAQAAQFLTFPQITYFRAF